MIFGLAFLGALSVLELILLPLFFIALVVGCTVDRRNDQEAVKWIILAIGAALVGYHFYSAGTGIPSISGIWETVTSWEFWKLPLLYIAAGLVYCIPEFFVDVRRSAKKYAEAWQSYITTTTRLDTYDAEGKDLNKREEVSIAEVIRRVISGALPIAYFRVQAERAITSFVGQYRFKNRIVCLKADKETMAVTPVINKIELAEHVAAWTIFWPAYLVSTVIGDLLVEIWNVAADFLVHISGRYVKSMFADVFKV